jgi:hypothetical protein
MENAVCVYASELSMDLFMAEPVYNRNITRLDQAK